MSGYSGTPLAKKLGIGAGCRLFLRAAPANYDALVAPLPGDVRLVSRIGPDTDLIHLFATRRAELARALASSSRAMRADAVVWVSWPKKSSGLTSDITEDTVRELALPLKLVDIKVCAVDDTWSALKLMVRKEARHAWPQGAERAPRAPRAAGGHRR